MPMLMTTFWTFGTCMRFVYPNCSVSAGTATSSNCLRRRGTMRGSALWVRASAAIPQSPLPLCRDGFDQNFFALRHLAVFVLFFMDVVPDILAMLVLLNVDADAFV